MMARLPVIVALLATLASASPVASAPATLTCVDSGTLNPRGAPVDTAISDDELGATLIHLDPATGEWFLQVPGSRALTNGGGTFEVLRESSFGRYWDEWVGIDHDTMLRIRGGGETALSFVFVSHRNGYFAGSCADPDEAFLLLAPRNG